MKTAPTASLKNDFLIQLVADKQLYLVSQELLNTSEFVNYFIDQSYISKQGPITVLEVPLAITTEQLYLWELWFIFMQQKTLYEGTEILLEQLRQEKRNVLKDLVRRLKIIPKLERCLEFCTEALKDAQVYPPPRSPSIWGKPPISLKRNMPSPTESPSSLTWMPMESPESFREKMAQMSPTLSSPSSSSLSNLESPYSVEWDDQELPDLFTLDGFTLD